MKKWYTSKSIWSGALLVITGIQQNVHFLEASIPPAAFGWVLFGVGVVVVGLRVVTNSAITK